MLIKSKKKIIMRISLIMKDDIIKENLLSKRIQIINIYNK